MFLAKSYLFDKTLSAQTPAVKLPSPELAIVLLSVVLLCPKHEHEFEQTREIFLQIADFLPFDNSEKPFYTTKMASICFLCRTPCPPLLSADGLFQFLSRIAEDCGLPTASEGLSHVVCASCAQLLASGLGAYAQLVQVLQQIRRRQEMMAGKCQCQRLFVRLAIALD